MTIEIEIEATVDGARVHLWFHGKKSEDVLLLATEYVKFGDNYETCLRTAVQSMRDLLTDVTVKKLAREEKP